METVNEEKENQSKIEIKKQKKNIKLPKIMKTINLLVFEMERSVKIL